MITTMINYYVRVHSHRAWVNWNILTSPIAWQHIIASFHLDHGNAPVINVRLCVLAWFTFMLKQTILDHKWTVSWTTSDWTDPNNGTFNHSIAWFTALTIPKWTEPKKCTGQMQSYNYQCKCTIKLPSTVRVSSIWYLNCLLLCYPKIGKLCRRLLLKQCLKPWWESIIDFLPAAGWLKEENLPIYGHLDFS